MPTRRLETWAVGTIFALALLPGRLLGLNRFDEGFVAAGAMMIRSGAWPLHDFYSPYGPGQYFVSAAVYSLFGEDLWVSRLADAATLGITGALVFACVRRMAGTLAAGLATLAFAAILAFAQPHANYAALSALPFLLVAALLFGDWLDTRRLRALAAASLAVGVVSTFRWDFGIYGVLSLVLATGLAMRSRADRGQAARAVFAAAAPAMALGVAVYALVLGRHAPQWFDEGPLFMTREFADWRNFEFIGPAVHTLERGLLHGDPYAAGKGAMHLAFAITPFVVLPISAWRSMRSALRPRAPLGGDIGIALLLSLCGLFLLLQMRVRPGLSQGLPAFTCALMLLPTIRPDPRWARNAFHAISFAGLALLCIAGIETQRKLWSASRVEPALERATGVHVPIGAGSVEYAALIAHLRATTAPSETILSGVVDTSRLLINDPMVYFLAGRRPATRFMEMEPGLSNTVRGQQEIVAELERHNVRTIVLLEMTSNEPNRTAISNGVTTLDDHVRRNFVETRRFAEYVVMVRRAPSALP